MSEMGFDRTTGASVDPLNKEVAIVLDLQPNLDQDAVRFPGRRMSKVEQKTEKPTLSLKPIETLQKDCEELARTAPGDVQKMASLMTQMSLRYYQDVRWQAQQSFYCASGAAVLGTLLFFYATGHHILVKNIDIGIISGTFLQIVSGISFYLYGRAARQFAAFHKCLERINRYLLANSICEHLSNDAKDRMRSELIHVMVHAPMIDVDLVHQHDKTAESLVEAKTLVTGTHRDRLKEETIASLGAKAS